MSDMPPQDPSQPPTPQDPPAPQVPPAPPSGGTQPPGYPMHPGAQQPAPGWGPAPQPGYAPPPTGQPGYPQQPYPAQPGYAPTPGYPQGQWAAPAPSAGMATGALVCGLVGIVFAIIPCTWWLGIVVSLVGLVLGIIASRSDQTVAAGATGKAKAGMILGGLGIVIAIAWIVLFFAIADAGTTYNWNFE